MDLPALQTIPLLHRNESILAQEWTGLTCMAMMAGLSPVWASMASIEGKPILARDRHQADNGTVKS